MDPFTHLAATRLVLGRQPAVLLASIAPDVPFYAVYPPWIVQRGLLREALQSGEWPLPPRWLLHAHRATHSLLVALIVASAVRWQRVRNNDRTDEDRTSML